MDSAPVAALAPGFRLRVSATALWFNIDSDRWNVIRSALEGVGAQATTASFDGEEMCATPGLTVTHRAAEGRMQSELSPFTASDTPVVLGALLQAAPPPAAQASPVWLFSPHPFTLAGTAAQPAMRVLRAARWLLPLHRAPDALSAAAEAYNGIAPHAGLRLHIRAQVELEFLLSPAAAEAVAPQQQAVAFGLLLTRLGQPTWAEYLTRPTAPDTQN